MTKNLNVKLIAAAFVAASAASIFSMGSAQASMTAELQNCKTNSRSATVHCCQAIVGQNLPYWMRETGRNCHTAVSCVGTKKTSDSISTAIAYVAAPKKKKTYCFIDFSSSGSGGGDGKNPPPPTTNKNPNNNPTGGVAGKQ